MSIIVKARKEFKDFCLDVDFKSENGITGILGASGDGKSMTLKCIAGVETPDSGYIELNGRVLFDSANKINLKPQERNVGYLFQSYALFPHMTVEDNIGAAIKGSKSEKKQIITQMLERFRLEGMEKRYPAQLSGGQQQRVALARILSYQPEILLLDEPFSALDFYLKEQLQSELKEVLEYYDKDVIIVTHSRDEIYQLCDNTMVLEDGNVITKQETHELFHNPRFLTAAKLTGCKNFSSIQIISEDTVFAKDWGVNLKVKAPIPPNTDYIGVRAHFFNPEENDSQVNTIKLHQAEKVERPFEWTVIFKPTEGCKGSIWWTFPKELFNNGKDIPQYLSIQPENIHLLESTKNIDV